jgi:hypothetical protein
MATNMGRAGLIARQVELHSVSLHKADLVSHVDPLNPPEELQLRQGYRARYELPKRHPEHLFVYVDLNFAASEQAKDEAHPDRVVLDATYLLAYTLKSDAEKPADALQHFAELNGTYNVWPYWRELVQTVTGRVGLAAIVVPVFRPRSRKLDESTGEGETSES